jgi:mRNA interferase HigB
MGACYPDPVRVIARGTLNQFVLNRVEKSLRAGVKSHLDVWYAEVSRDSWKNSAEVKQQYRSASIVSAERVVFNIKGNEYRLVIAVNYQLQIVFIVWIGTHREYDKIDVGEIRYEKQRYSGSSSPH